MQSFTKPTNKELNAALPLLSSPEHEAYFFSRLKNPLWITPLNECDIFKYPPTAEPVKGGGIRYPSWPPTKYLARMAGLAPCEVASILSGIETDNASIVGDLLDAAMAMPEDVAASLVPMVSNAANEGTLYIHFKDASDLCVRLAEGGQADSALQLACTLFSPTFDEGKKELHGRDLYWYKDGLARVVSVLATRKSNEFLKQLCDWLRTIVEAKNSVGRETSFDLSYIWRPAIEEHEQNHDHDLAGVMVGYVRQGFELAIHGGQINFEHAKSILDAYPYLVFKRIRLHLINEFAEQVPALAREHMLDRRLFDNDEYKHEYAMLVGKRLSMLEAEQREVWYGWVDTGPDMTNYDDMIRRNYDREATDSEREGRKNRWKYEKLHCVRSHLDGDRLKFYQQMLADHGEPELADLNVYCGSIRRGNESPIEVKTLAAMTFEQAVARVTSWQPDESQPIGPDIEGLASTFGQYIATNPILYSKSARALIEKPAIYIRHFVRQMAVSAKVGGAIDLSSVFALCQWVLTRPLNERTTPEQKHEGLVDKDWQWTRDEVSTFVESICKAKQDDKPYYPLEGVRVPLWGLVEQLCRDRSRSNIVRDLSKEDPRVLDYLDLAINSPRGKALEAGLEYARWVANHIKQVDQASHEIVPNGFDAMPEVREMLEWQIAVGNRSFEAMAIIGSRIWLLNWIDQAWLHKNSEFLFRLHGIEKDPQEVHGWAAWNAFLVWVSPHIEFYRIFRSQFAYACEQAGKTTPGRDSDRQPMNRLGEHLMILYGRGQLSLDDDNGLIRRFINTANSSVRRHTIGFVGQSIKGDDKVPEEVTERFQDLWELYWNGPGKEDLQEKPGAWLYGTWFSSGKFPDQWALDKLYDYVEVTPTPEPDHSIAERLAEIGHVDILKAIKIVDRMIRSDSEGWRIHGWNDHARLLLGQAMDAGGEARSIAKALINYLGRYGYHEFGRLLKANH